MIIHPDDMFLVKEVLWPRVQFFNKQVQIVESTFTNKETYVTAANKMGKDFVAGFIALGAFVVCLHQNITCRIVTTSVAEHHLKVLWGEIGRYLTTSAQPLMHTKGGPLTANYQEIRRHNEADSKNPINYLVGRVSAKGEGLAGHHAEFTLFIGDEASGLDDLAYEMAQGWAKHMLFISNPNQTTNFFKRGVKAGDLVAL